jgi:hypothetical protein
MYAIVNILLEKINVVAVVVSIVGLRLFVCLLFEWGGGGKTDGPWDARCEMLRIASLEGNVRAASVICRCPCWQPLCGSDLHGCLCAPHYSFNLPTCPLNGLMWPEPTPGLGC